MNDKILGRREAEAAAVKALSELPARIRHIVERLPFGPRWALAGTISELQKKSDVYISGIAVGMISAASTREEISHEQMETLCLYVGNMSPTPLLTR